MIMLLTPGLAVNWKCLQVQYLASYRASRLTVLWVVYAIVWLSSGRTMVSILHVDLISCWCLVLCSAPEVGSKSRTRENVGHSAAWCKLFIEVPSRWIKNVWFLLAITASQWCNLLFNKFSILLLSTSGDGWMDGQEFAT